MASELDELTESLLSDEVVAVFPLAYAAQQAAVVDGRDQLGGDPVPPMTGTQQHGNKRAGKRAPAMGCPEQANCLTVAGA